MTYTYYYSSPMGPLKLEASDTHLVSLDFLDELPANPDSTSNTIIEHTLKELELYFKGELTEFTVPVALTGTSFQNKVWEQLNGIPYGTTISYSDLALKLGDLKTIRAAGTANGKNKIPIIIPCHRVIGKDGSLVGFSGGLDRKKWLLKHEGVIRSEQMEIFG